jgi:GntR family transcriptional repressor for pyruvate dehydrogenase complex
MNINKMHPFTSVSLSDQVEKFVLDELRSQRLRPGDVLPPESMLAAQLGVSRAPVREAMARLRAAGVLDTKPGRGSVILSSAPNAVRFSSAPDSTAFDENLFELRVALESETAALAALRHDESDLAAIQAAFDAMQAAALSGTSDAHADLAFHRAIAIATHNPYMVSMVEYISDKLTVFLQTAWDNSQRIGTGPRPAQREHVKLLAAIRKRDAQAARQAALMHLQASKRRLQARISAVADNPAQGRR